MGVDAYALNAGSAAHERTDHRAARGASDRADGEARPASTADVPAAGFPARVAVDADHALVMTSYGTRRPELSVGYRARWSRQLVMNCETESLTNSASASCANASSSAPAPKRQ